MAGSCSLIRVASRCWPGERPPSCASAGTRWPARRDLGRSGRTGAVGSDMPRGIIGHRTLDAEQTSVEIGDDQEEDVTGVGGGHGPCSVAQILPTITDVIAFHARQMIDFAGI